MSETAKADTYSPATDADGKLLLAPTEADALLRQCFAEVAEGLQSYVRACVETTNDLFEMSEHVSDADALDFRGKRDAWLDQFRTTLQDLFDKRLSGVRRQGRRPDFDASLTTLRVLNAFDQEKQAALTAATRILFRTTKREANALDVRVGLLLREPRARDVDNPLSPSYILDAIGLSSRALYPNPRVWRPFMERVLADLTPGMNKIYMRGNRFLADHGVLPEIKAELRARSDLRPRDDSELLPTFFQLFKEAGASVAEELLALNIQVPPASQPPPAGSASSTGPSPALPPVHPSVPYPNANAPPGAMPVGAGQVGPGGAFHASAPSGGAGYYPAVPAPFPVGGPGVVFVPGMAPAQGVGPTQGTLQGQGPSSVGAAHAAPAPMTIPAGAWTIAANPYVLDVAAAPGPAGSSASTNVMGLPQLDPLMALGSLSAAIAVLDRWQRSDPGADAAVASSEDGAAADAPMAPLNRIPFMRSAIADKVGSSTDKITMDVIGLLFDYIFRDPSIPASLRSVFTRLQVPILKTALIDRSFFSDRKHPARRLLDHLAAAAIGATGDAGYAAAFELIATGVVDEICREFKVDIATFEGADAKLLEFVDVEQRKAAPALEAEVARALAAEENEADRSKVRAIIRDKLAGLDVPFAVRSFSESIWADYLTMVRVEKGTGADAWGAGLQTLDDLLWSITAKDRAAQKARLARMVPPLIKSLRAGGLAVKVAGERLQPFLDAIYELHMAAIKPKPPEQPQETVPPLEAVEARETTTRRIDNVHDFVSEMVIGTWLSFNTGPNPLNARLSWVSPLRSKYIFTSRERSRAIVLTPEELAWQLGAGKATLVVEPVPLFDRAVSAALDSIAARRKPAADAAAA
jgi:uncharacterized protein DUF1631